MRFFLRSLIVVSLLGAFSTQAQVQLHIANDYYRDLRFQKAIKYYIAAIKRKPTLEATQKLAHAYRFTKNYPRAEFWYEKAVTYPGSPPANMFHYGQMLKTNEKFDQARAVFERYAAMPGVDVASAQLLIASCDSAKKWMASPASFALTNRNDLNSVYSDFGTARLSDVAYVYTSNRPMNNKGEVKLSKDLNAPYYSIVYSRLDANGKAMGVQPFRFSDKTDYHEATASFTANYDTIYFTQTRVSKRNRERINRLGIYYSVRKDSIWSEPRAFPYNNPNYSVGHPYLNKQGNELYFVSDVGGGQGGYDIYMCTWQNGGWSAPQNLGPVINSKDDEFYPVIRENLLYFSSEGNIGLGGLDIFYTERGPGGYGTPKNLKTPFNSPQDDFAIYFDDTKETGFVSSNRTGGLGFDDIYSFDYKKPLPVKYFLDVKPYYTDGNARVRLAGGETNVYRSSDNEPAVIASLKDKTYFVVQDGVNYTIKTRKNGFLNTAEVAAIKDFTIVDTVVLSKMPEELAVIVEYSVKMEQLALNKSYELKEIYYDFNKATLRPEATTELDRLVTILKENPAIIVQLGSYCDSRGNDAYNLNLSQRRAQSVVDYLTKKGIKRSRLSAKGYGETKLVNHCSNGVPCTEEEHQMNRRTDFQIVDIQK